MKTKVDKALLRVQIPFDKEKQIPNLDRILAGVFATLHEKAFPEHKFLIMNFVLSDEPAGELENGEETKEVT